jgi:hypothetical protein
VTATTEEDAPLLFVGSATKPCRSCKHELPLVAFQKARRGNGGEIRVLKCCDTCREKQNVRSAAGGLNERHNAAAKAARHALKASAAAGDADAIAAIAAAREKAAKKNAELLAEHRAAQLARERKVDLTLDLWKHESVEYYRNDAGDVISLDGEWVGRWTGSAIDTAAPEPAYFDSLATRD